MSLKNKQYELMELKREDLDPDPFKQFDLWYSESIRSEIKYPNAFVLSTSTISGTPSSRVLLYKGRNERGFRFYTNVGSKKGQDLKNNKKASMCFWWDEIEKQVRIEGAVDNLSDEESDDYFQTRPRGSQLGAWASDQSNVIGSREELDSLYKHYENEFAGIDVPRPDHWRGYIVIPEEFEFWQGGKDRLHDRFRYRLENHEWIIERIAP